MIEIMNNTVIIRTRLAGEIVAEVAFPARQTGKVAILAIGLPSSVSRRGVMEFLASHGYVVVFPRYRGSWESGGYFLERSPADDIRDVIEELITKKSVFDVFTRETHKVDVRTIHLFGGSFGGPAVLLNSRHRLVKKVIALSPVIDWKTEGEDEPFAFWTHYVNDGFGGVYRTRHKNDWQKLIETDFYNPLTRTSEIDGQKIFIIQTKDDTVVPYAPLIPFANATGATYYLKTKGGHFGFRKISQKFYWHKIEMFLKKK